MEFMKKKQSFPVKSNFTTVEMAMGKQFGSVKWFNWKITEQYSYFGQFLTNATSTDRP
jgi:hypothetical protein